MEKWEKVDSVPLSVSNYGRIRYEKTGKINFGHSDVYGYMRVSCKGEATNKRLYFKVHRLVAKYFVDGYSEELTVHHIDHRKDNNHWENLTMLTASENAKEHYIYNSDSYSSKHVGVNFHKGIGKWVARYRQNGFRFSLGSYDTESEAALAIVKFKRGEMKPVFGKGSGNKPRYSEEMINEIVNRSLIIGVRKCAKEYGVGTTSISYWRRKLKNEIKDRTGKTENGIFVKNQ